MITRSVKGKPDEYTNRMNMPSDFSANVDSVYNYYMDASSSTSGGDSQPDEFQFNCNGYSGKFVLDNNYVPRVTATSNVKITMDMLVTPNSTAGYINTTKMKDTLGLANSQKDSIYAINISLHEKKMAAWQRYATAGDSLRWHVQKIENTRDSLYHQILSEPQFFLYRQKKSRFITN